jgi:tetratricopeptide (TPR) repeat protein
MLPGNCLPDEMSFAYAIPTPMCLVALFSVLLCKAARRAVLAMVLLVLGPAAPAFEVVYRSTGLSVAEPGDPVAADLDRDGVYEIVVAGARGRLAAYNSQTLKPLWDVQVSPTGITPPVVGDFLGDGTPLLALGATDGHVYFLWPGSGRTHSRFDAGVAISVAPCIVPLKRRDGSDRDGLAFCDDAGSVRLLSMVNGQPVEEFSVPNAFTEFVHDTGQQRNVNIGRISRPPSVADVNGDGIPEIVVGTVSGGVQATPIHDPQLRYWWRAPQGTNICTSIAAADFQKTGMDQIAFGTTGGELYVLAYESSQQTQLYFRVVQRQRLLGPANGPLLIADFDGDGYLDIAGASNATVATFDGAAQMANFGAQPYATHATPLSAVSAVQVAGGGVRLLFGDSAGGVILLDPLLKDEGERFRGKEPMSGVCLAGNLTGSGRLEAAYLADGGKRLVVAQLDSPAPESGVPPVQAYGVNFRRDSQFTTATFEAAARAGERADAAFAALVARGQAALGSDRAEAGRIAAVLADLRPAAAETQALVSQTIGRFAWVKRTAVAMVLAVIAGAAAFAGYRVYERRTRETRAARYMQAGNYRGAITQYRAILASGNRSRKVLLALADAYIAAGHTGADAVDVLEEAYRADPEHPGLMVTLAHAYAAAGVETDEALNCYQVALATLPSGRQQIGFHAGNILMARGDLHAAQKVYRIAVRDGNEDPELHERLAEIALQTGQFTEKMLPHLEAVRDRHTGDIRFLDGLCRALAAARRTDDAARSAYEALLAANPESVVAMRQLAKCELKDGRAAEAAAFAKRARAIMAKDAETIQLLAQCYVMMGRTDDEAVAVYREGLEVAPGQPEILRALGTALVTSGAESDEDYLILKQAAMAHNRDTHLLLGLAEAARKRGETHTVIKCLERVRAFGADSPGVAASLAAAYVEAEVTADEAEPVYREALSAQPDNKEVVRLLATILARRGETGQDAMMLMERAFHAGHTDKMIGQQLARAYLHNERFDDAAKICRWLLQQDKDDTEVQRLFAEASLRSNRIDEAIRQYETLHRLHPDDREATLQLAIAYAQKQCHDAAAAQVYAQALALDPDCVPVRLAYARHHAESGRIARGIEEYRLAIRSDPRCENRIAEEISVLIAASPDRSDLRWFLANILIDRFRLGEALEQLEAIFESDPLQMKSVLQALDRILAKDPANQGANLQKGILLKAQGRFEEARPFLERAHKANTSHAEAARELEDLYIQLAKETDDIQVVFELGKLCYALGEYDKAIGHFQRTAMDFRYENESIKHLGLCFVGKGMLEFALQEFKKLVVDEEMKAILYDLAHRYEAKNDVVGAKQVYRILYAADVNYRDVKKKFDQLVGSTSDPLTLDRSALLTQLGEKAQRRYELLEELGRGAMGIVYKAKDKELDEIVALKILPDSLSQSPEAIHRFRAEARSARRLAHPNIVRIHDIGEELGRKFISMEYIDGTDLKRHFKQSGPLPVGEGVEIVKQICSALDYAHSMNIVHRDIKPANIMLTKKLVVKVSDFGIAKMLESTSETIAGAIIGTPIYMSPEQVQGHPVDNGADIYSLGVMMYELFSGRPPFTGGDLAYQHVNVPPPPLTDIPQELVEIIMRCLAKKRADRWATAGEILRALERHFGPGATLPGVS